MRHTVVRWVLTAALVLGACGGGDGGVDEATLERLLPTEADMAGYELVPEADDEDDPDDADFEATLEACFDEDVLDDDDALSREFATVQGDITVEVSAGAASSRDESADELDAIRQGFGDQCVVSAFAEFFSDELDTEVTGDIAPLALATETDLSAAYQLTLAVTIEGQPVPFYLDFVFLGEDRLQVSLFAFSPGIPFPADERTRLVGLLTERLAEEA